MPEKKIPPCSKHAYEKEYIIYSCCGDDITNNLPDNDICPTCKEHCGEGNKEFL